MNTRKKLKKLLNKELNYTGVVGNFDETNCKICIESVQFEGKEVTDHVWVSNIHSLKKHGKGTRVTFFATAYTYNDSKNRRKNGLGRCKSFKVVNEAYSEISAKEYVNLQNRRKT